MGFGGVITQQKFFFFLLNRLWMRKTHKLGIRVLPLWRGNSFSLESVQSTVSPVNKLIESRTEQSTNTISEQTELLTLGSPNPVCSQTESQTQFYKTLSPWYPHKWIKTLINQGHEWSNCLPLCSCNNGEIQSEPLDWHEIHWQYRRSIYLGEFPWYPTTPSYNYSYNYGRGFMS